MLRRFSVNFAVLSMVLDAAFTLLALLAAVELRPVLPPLPFLHSLTVVRLPGHLYLIAPLLWVLVFLILSVYDPRRVYKVVDEFQWVSIGAGLAALSFAGLLFLTFRSFSRWLFITFVLIDLLLLLGWRGVARLMWRFIKVPPVRRRVLNVGAGKVGIRIGRMVREYAWTGPELVERGITFRDTRHVPGPGGKYFFLWPSKYGCYDSRLYAEAVLNAVPEGTLLLAEPVLANPIRFLQVVEHRRPDVTIYYCC